MQFPAVLKVQHLRIVFLHLFSNGLRGLLDRTSEVSHFGNIVLHHKNIQSFYVPMDNAILMQIANSEANVDENFPYHIFVKSFSKVILFLNKSVKISVRTVL
jgi:7-cyano-7-deazaguanine synthase in queuosine biosynthesis